MPAHGTTPKRPKNAKDVGRSKAYSPKAETEAFRDSIKSISEGYLDSVDKPAGEFRQVENELLAAAGAIPSWLQAVAEVTLVKNPETNSFGFQLDGGIEFNSMPSLVNLMCEAAPGSAVLPKKALLIKIGDQFVAGETHDNIIQLVIGSTDEIKVLVTPWDENEASPTIQELLKCVSEEELPLSVVKHVRKQVHKLTMPITTRPLKLGEQEGVEYNFVHEAVFKKMADNDEFFEYSEVNGVYYGSPLIVDGVVDEESMLKRRSSIKRKPSYDRMGEATVAHVLEGTDIAPEVIAHLDAHEVQDTRVSQLPLTAFFEAMDLDDEKLGTVKESVRNAVYEITVPFTTRPPREGEKDGREYNFVSVEEFKALIEADRLLEYGVLNNNLYGTAKVEEITARKAHRITRTETLREALLQKHKGAKVGELLYFSSLKGSEAHESVKHHSIAHFLSSVPNDDPVYGELRTSVKNWLYDCTVPYTTRPPRDAEVNGRDYHFIKPSEFHTMVAEDRFIEYGELNGYWYGTLKIVAKDLQHTAETPRYSRTAMKRAADKKGLNAVTVEDMEVLVGDSLNVGDDQAQKSLTEFLQSVDEEDESLSDARAKIKQALYNVTVPLTTRPPRAGERNGREYHFVSREQFETLVKEDKMLEFGIHNGEFYGTLKPSAAEIQAPEHDRSRITLSSTELTVGQISHLLSSSLTEAHMKLPISKFLAHISDEDEEDGSMRHEVKDVVLDMTVPYTTRARRDGEHDGSDYFFVENDVFEKLFDEDFFIEVGEVNGFYYGTPKVTIDHLDDDSAPIYSRMKYTQSRLTNPLGEVTMAHFAEVLKIEELLQVSHVPLSMYLAKIDPEHPVHGPIREKVKDMLYEMSIPVTTRTRREGEANGREYYFVSEEDFNMMIANKTLVEWGERNGNMYGTPIVQAAHVSKEQPYVRSIHMMEVHKSKQRHAKVKDVLPNSVHPLMKTVGNLSISEFLSKVEPEHAALGDLREELKAQIYLCTTPYTTRPMRPGEQNGVEYNYIDVETFKKMIDNDQLLEWGEIKGSFYGTPYIYEAHIKEGGIEEKLKDRSRRRSMSLAVSTNQSPAARAALQNLEDILQREEALKRKVDAVKIALASKDEVEDDDLRALVDKLHVIVNEDEGEVGSSEPPLPQGPVAGPAATTIKVVDKETVDLNKTIEGQESELEAQRAKITEMESEKQMLEKKLDEQQSTIDALRVQSKVNDVTATLSQLDNLHEALKSLPAKEQKSAAPSPAKTPDLPTSVDTAWSKDSIKAKLAARRRWQNAEATATTMSPLKAKLAARRRAKAQGGVSSTGNAPAMGIVASALMAKSKSLGAEPSRPLDESEPETEPESKPVSPAKAPTTPGSPKQSPTMAKLLVDAEQGDSEL